MPNKSNTCTSTQPIFGWCELCCFGGYIYIYIDMMLHIMYVIDSVQLKSCTSLS